jgi:hypothetical protein
LSSKVREAGHNTPRRDEKSVEVTERKEDAHSPLWKRVRKRLKTKRLGRLHRNQGRVNGGDLGIESVLELGKHGKE